MDIQANEVVKDKINNDLIGRIVDLIYDIVYNEVDGDMTVELEAIETLVVTYDDVTDGVLSGVSHQLLTLAADLVTSYSK